jgi:hypothetical protein
MVRRILRLLAAAAAVLTLGTCALFTDSLFPWYLSGVTDTRDMTPWIDYTLVPEDMSEYDWGVDLAVLRDHSGTDYVFVAVHGYTGSRLIVLNSDLSLVPAADNPMDGVDTGRRFMVDANGDFVVGTQIITNPSFSPGGTTPGGWDDLGLSIGTDNLLFSIDYGHSPPFRYTICPAGWGSYTDRYVDISSSAADNWELAAVAYDAQRSADQNVVLMFRTWGYDDDEGWVFYVPEADATSTLMTPLTAYPGFSVTPRDGVNRMHYTRKGIVVRDHSDRATLYRFNPNDWLRLDFNTRHDVLDAYDLDGEYFYVLDKDLRMLYKGRTGW